MNALQKKLIKLLGGFTPEEKEQAVSEAVRATRVLLNLSSAGVDKMIANVKAHLRKAESVRDDAAQKAEEARRKAQKEQERSDRAGSAATATSEVLETIATMPLEDVDPALNIPEEEEENES